MRLRGPSHPRRAQISCMTRTLTTPFRVLASKSTVKSVRGRGGCSSPEWDHFRRGGLPSPDMHTHGVATSSPSWPHSPKQMGKGIWRAWLLQPGPTPSRGPSPLPTKVQVVHPGSQVIGQRGVFHDGASGNHDVSWDVAAPGNDTVQGSGWDRRWTRGQSGATERGCGVQGCHPGEARSALPSQARWNQCVPKQRKKNHQPIQTGHALDSGLHTWARPGQAPLCDPEAGQTLADVAGRRRWRCGPLPTCRGPETAQLPPHPCQQRCRHAIPMCACAHVCVFSALH